jgi:hypothetical protein
MTEPRRATFACALTLVALAALVPAGPRATVSPPKVARTVLALYDSAHAPHLRLSDVHTYAEMPLNHLGLVVRYHDIRAGFPPVATLAGVRGVLTWFSADAMPDPQGYLRWLSAVARTGRPIVIIGALGASQDEKGNRTPLPEINRVLTHLGWRFDGGWLPTTYGATYEVLDQRLVGFERPLPTVVPPYSHVAATAPDAKVVLRVGIKGRPSTASDLLIVSPRGAYIAPGFALFTDRGYGPDFRQWYVNPFEFFRVAFATDDVPKADTTTLSGRRIYYSHVDGDGWRNLTQVEPYRTRYTISARVVLDEVIRKFPDLPVTVGAVVGDLDPAWHGSRESLEVARAIYREPHVEAAVHTYSHPFEWGLFDPAAAPPARTPGDEPQRLSGSDLTHADQDGEGRAYDVRPFSVKTEIDDATAFVTGLLPPGKRVQLVQWTGDTLPFEAVVQRARDLGLANINGGDTRFDREFPSAAWVAPLGMPVGRERQVFASNSNENTYTDLWRSRFFGFSFLTATVRNTGSPRRLKPVNVYYHVYSGERLSSLNAVLSNLTYARSQPLVPIETSRFSRIVEGFFSVVFEPAGRRAWLVRDRGALQTIRIDHATLEGVDFARSRGIVGQRHELGSLFVALDETEPAPVVALKPVAASGREPREPMPYLVDARWRVFEVRRSEGAVRFAAAGFGAGDFTWQWPWTGAAVVLWRGANGQTGRAEARADAAGLLRLRLPQMTGIRVDVSITAQQGAPGAD